MIISFEEKDRAVIKAAGMTIIEFKRNLYRSKKEISDGLIVLVDIIDKFSEAVILLRDVISEAIDNVKFMVEEISEAYRRPTSSRYKVVKFLSRCTGIEKHRLWTMTRHTWLARSCC